MSKIRIAFAVLAFAIIGWAAYVVSSLRQIDLTLPAVPTAIQNDRETLPDLEDRVTDPVPIDGSAEVVTNLDEPPPSRVSDVTEEAAADTLGRDVDFALDPPISAEETCALMSAYLLTYNGTGVRIVNALNGLPAEDLRAIADSDDEGIVVGIAQLLYARFHLVDEEDKREYFIRAARNRISTAASLLGSMAFPLDQVEAGAWWLIEQRLGGSTLARLEEPLNRRLLLGSDVQEEAEIRLESLLVEHELGQALSTSDECL